jgi:transcriptional regulator with XRE-family HTH domain
MSSNLSKENVHGASGGNTVQGKSDFATLLRFRMKEEGLTQAALAALVGVQQSTISKFLNGMIEPSESILEKLGEVLDLSNATLQADTKVMAAKLSIGFVFGLPTLGLVNLFINGSSQASKLAYFEYNGELAFDNDSRDKDSGIRPPYPEPIKNHPEPLGLGRFKGYAFIRHTVYQKLKTAHFFWSLGFGKALNRRCF